MLTFCDPVLAIVRACLQSLGHAHTIHNWAVGALWGSIQAHGFLSGTMIISKPAPAQERVKKSPHPAEPSPPRKRGSRVKD